MIDDSQQARNWAMGCHLAALALYLGIPFGNIIGPLIIWLLKKDQFPLVDEQGKESLNFQISLVIYSLVGATVIGALAVTILLAPLAIILGFLLLLLFVINLVLIIVAAVNVSNGRPYQYPLTIRFIK